MSNNTCVYFTGTPVAGGQGVWRDSTGNSGIAVYNGDGSFSKL
jgi:hypothetical protein